MFTLQFLKAVGERAFWAFAASLLAVIGVGQVALHEVNWGYALSVSAVAAIVSVLKSVVVAGSTDGSPSLTGAETLSDN